MSDRKVTLELKVKLTVSVAEGRSMKDVIEELDHSFTSCEDQIHDSEITDFEVLDSK